MGLRDDLAIADARRGAGITLVRRLVAAGPVAAVVRSVLTPLDRAVHRLSGGRSTASGAAGRLPVVFVTTTGRRSGLPRTVPLVAVPHGDDLAVIGSNWGGPEDPAWVRNLEADPNATVEHRRRRAAVRARVLEGDEARAVWRAGEALYPGYAAYRERAGREIRVFALEPRRETLREDGRP